MAGKPESSPAKDDTVKLPAGIDIPEDLRQQYEAQKKIRRIYSCAIRRHPTRGVPCHNVRVAGIVFSDTPNEAPRYDDADPHIRATDKGTLNRRSEEDLALYRATVKRFLVRWHQITDQDGKPYSPERWGAEVINTYALWQPSGDEEPLEPYLRMRELSHAEIAGRFSEVEEVAVTA